MRKSVIIIPARLSATRLPRKPLLKINNMPMIIHTMRCGIKSNVGDVIIATPDKEIFDLVEKYSGKAMITRKDHASGTDRVAEVIAKLSDDDIKICINLQVDLPNLHFEDIKKLNYLMQKYKCEIGTLASVIQNTNELKNKNIVKVETKETLNDSNFINAIDFFRETPSSASKIIYHHVGIYAYDVQTLNKYVNLKRTKNEIERSLEQMRAIDNNINIHVALSSSLPLGVDTKEEFVAVKKTMEYKG
mgnify:CR=1 FL=1